MTQKLSFVCSACLPLVGVGLVGFVACGGQSDVGVVTIADGGDGGGAGNEAATTDGATDAGDLGDTSSSTDGGAGEDAGPGGNTTQIACGTATCSLATEICCVYQNANAGNPGSGPSFAFSCATGTTCPAPPPAFDPATPMTCSSAANCTSGNVCCITSDGPSNNIASSCKPSCTATKPAIAATLCDPGAPPIAGCACSAKNIDSWALPNGYGTCGGVDNTN